MMAKPVDEMEDHIEDEEINSVSPWREAWKEFKRNKIALVGLLIVLFFILLAIFASFLTKEVFNEQVMSDRLHPPASEYCLETGDFGRDILSRIILAARISLWLAFSSVIGSLIAGSFFCLL